MFQSWVASSSPAASSGSGHSEALTLERGDLDLRKLGRVLRPFLGAKLASFPGKPEVPNMEEVSEVSGWWDDLARLEAAPLQIWGAPSPNLWADHPTCDQGNACKV